MKTIPDHADLTLYLNLRIIAEYQIERVVDTDERLALKAIVEIRLA